MKFGISFSKARKYIVLISTYVCKETYVKSGSWLRTTFSESEQRIQLVFLRMQIKLHIVQHSVYYN